MNPTNLLADGDHMFSKSIWRAILQGVIFICYFLSIFRGCAEPLNQMSQNSDSNTTTVFIAGVFNVHFGGRVDFRNFKMKPEIHDCIR